MSICIVTGTLVDSSTTGVSGATVKFRTVRAVLDASNSLVLPVEISTTTASNGSWTLNIDQGISGIMSFDFPPSVIGASQRQTYSIAVPASTSCPFYSLVTMET